MKTSKVTDVNFKKEFDGKYGKMFVHTVKFENGDSGEYTSTRKDQSNFVAGQEATYEIKSIENEYGTFYKVKPVRDNNFGGRKFDPEKDKRITRLSAIKSAIDYCSVSDTKPKSLEEVFEIANKIANYSYGATAKPEPAPAPKVEEKPPTPPEEGVSIDDLPF